MDGVAFRYKGRVCRNSPFFCLGGLGLDSFCKYLFIYLKMEKHRCLSDKATQFLVDKSDVVRPINELTFIKTQL